MKREAIEKRLEGAREYLADREKELTDAEMIIEMTDQQPLEIAFGERRYCLTRTITYLRGEIAFLEGLLE